MGRLGLLRLVPPPDGKTPGTLPLDQHVESALHDLGQARVGKRVADKGAGGIELLFQGRARSERDLLASGAQRLALRPCIATRGDLGQVRDELGCHLPVAVHELLQASEQGLVRKVAWSPTAEQTVSVKGTR